MDDLDSQIYALLKTIDQRKRELNTLQLKTQQLISRRSMECASNGGHLYEDGVTHPYCVKCGTYQKNPQLLHGFQNSRFEWESVPFHQFKKTFG